MKNKGITLIALIVTIIIMLILAAVSIKILGGENGIITKAREAAFKQELAQYKESFELYKALGDEVEDTWDAEIVQNYTGKFQHPRKIGFIDGKIWFRDTGKKEETRWAEEIGYNIMGERVEIELEVIGKGKAWINNEEITENLKTEARVESEIELKAIDGVVDVEGRKIAYEFAGWYKDGIKLSEKTNYKFEVLKGGKYQAIFEPTETLIYYLEDGQEKIFVDETIDLKNYMAQKATIGVENITRVDLGSKVETIPARAFQNAVNMEISIIPEKCLTIEGYAFYGCDGITSIKSLAKEELTLRGNSFEYCKNLETLILPTVKQIQTDTAVGDYKLKEVILGSKGNPIEYIYNFTFYNCNQSDLTIKIYIESGKTNLEQEPWEAKNATIEYYSAETGELINVILGQRYKGNTEIYWTKWEDVPNYDKITVIKAGAFEGCTNLALENLSEKIEYIGNSAFKDCKNIKISKLPEKCLTIGEYAFCGCENITKIESLAKEEISIGMYAFNKCKNLETLILPTLKNAVREMASSNGKLKEIILGSKGNPVGNQHHNFAFYACSQSDLTIKVYVEEGTTRLDGEPWEAKNATIEYYSADTGELINVILGQKYKGNTDINWTKWEDVPNGDKITWIKTGAFEGCTNLALENLSEKIEYIGNSAFKDCKNTKISKLPEKCLTIGEYAFCGCEEITKIESFAKEEITIGIYAFNKCGNLETLILPTLKNAVREMASNNDKLKEIILGSKGNPVEKIYNFAFYKCLRSDLTIKLYIEEETTKLTEEPWEAKNATIEYYSADTGELVNTEKYVSGVKQ